MRLSNNEKQRLKTKYGEWAIITGASSGIGLELATQLASAGFGTTINFINSSLHAEMNMLKVNGEIT